MINVNKPKTKKNSQDIRNFELLYSPRTEYSNKLEYEEVLFHDLTLNFDPITIKIIKKHFKERWGSWNKDEFISILKNHLLSWHPDWPNRETMLIKLLGRWFSEIDLNDNGSMEWAEFTNYIIHNSNSNNKQAKTDNPAYRLRFYYPSKFKWDTSDFKDNVSNAFYIEKYNWLGLIQEGRSYITFYDTITFKRLKTVIDLKEIQKEFDDLEISEFDNKANEFLANEAKNILKLQNKTNTSKFRDTFGNTKWSWMSNNMYKTTRTQNDDSEGNDNDNITSYNKNSKSLRFPNFKDMGKTATLPRIRHQRNENQQTPEKVKKEIERIKMDKKRWISNKKLTAICTWFIPEFDVLLVSTTNNKIAAWQYINREFKNVNSSREFIIEKNYFKCAILSSDLSQNTMCWDPIQRFLYTGQGDGKVLKWDLSKTKNIEKESLIYQNAKLKLLADRNWTVNKDSQPYEKCFVEEVIHTNYIKIPSWDQTTIQTKHIVHGVSCLLILGKLQWLAASYYNGNIILWDPLLKDFRKFYYDQFSGVYSMSYDPVKNLLITAGFNHDIYIYDPYIDNCAIYKLIGHNWSINSLVTNEKESEIISLDILGNIKWWDSQNFLNFQTINLNETIDSKKNNENIGKKKFGASIKMWYMAKIKKILIYGSKLMILETDRSQNPDWADDQIILACYFDKVTKTILSFCLRKIKMWNIFTGKLKNVYEDPMNNEITALTIDRNMKRAFLGDNTGKIKNYNMKNGKFLKELESHSFEINMITHSLTLNIVVSCSTDNVIKIHDDSELTESEVKKEIVIGTGTVKAISIGEKFGRLAIGLSSGWIRFYDIEHYRFDSDTHNETKNFGDEVTCLAFWEDVEIIFSGHLSGTCRFIVTPPSSMKFYEIYAFSNSTGEEKQTECTISPNKKRSSCVIQTIPVTCAEYDIENKWIFLGDQIGFLKCYDLTNLFDMIAFGKEHSKSETDPIITLEVVREFENKWKIPQKWCVEAHKEAIKHIHYVNIIPRIVITTSNDLKIRLFSAETGRFKDELRQISIKYKPVPIGIKYHIIDPFKSNDEQVDEEHILLRKDWDIYSMQNLNDIENQPISEYSKKITEYNAKEKLWLNVKGSKLKEYQSNKWDWDIDIEQVKIREEEDLKEEIQVVREKERWIQQTEMIMQQKSIYSESYKPQFVSEMDENQLQDFSNVLSKKLRQVKLAISKANLGQNKFAAFEEEKKKKEQMSKLFHNMLKTGYETKSSMKKVVKKPIKSIYKYERPRLKTAEDNFKKCWNDYITGHDEAMKACEIWKSKARVLTTNANKYRKFKMSTKPTESNKEYDYKSTNSDN